MIALNFNFRKILKLEWLKNHENEAIRSLEEPFLNPKLTLTGDTYNFYDVL